MESETSLKIKWLIRENENILAEGLLPFWGKYKKHIVGKSPKEK